MQTQMPRYFRNKVEVSSIEGICVDPFSLWIWDVKRKLMVLEDKDQDVTHLKNSNFIKTL